MDLKIQPISDYRHTLNFLRLVPERKQTDGQTDSQTCRCNQVHNIPASLSYAVDNDKYVMFAVAMMKVHVFCIPSLLIFSVHGLGVVLGKRHAILCYFSTCHRRILLVSRVHLIWDWFSFLPISRFPLRVSSRTSIIRTSITKMCQVFALRKMSAERHSLFYLYKRLCVMPKSLSCY